MSDPLPPRPPPASKGRVSATSSALVLEGRDGERRVIALGSEEILIGRGEHGTTVRLPERDISRRHACFSCSNGAVWVEDLGSSNGTRINGEPIQGKRRIREGDLVQIGGYDIAVLGTVESPPGTAENAPQPDIQPVPPEPPTAVQLPPLPEASRSAAGPITSRLETSPSAAAQREVAGGGPAPPLPTEHSNRAPPLHCATPSAMPPVASSNPRQKRACALAPGGNRAMVLLAVGVLSLLLGWAAGRLLHGALQPAVTATTTEDRR